MDGEAVIFFIYKGSARARNHRVGTQVPIERKKPVDVEAIYPLRHQARVETRKDPWSTVTDPL